MKKLFFFPLLSMLCLPALADVKLPQLFADNMILQRNAPITIWGWAAAGEKVNIRLHQQSRSVKADKEGNWRVLLDQESAGGPYELLVTGKNSIVLKGVLIGEVWICSGQSNMEFSLKGAQNAAEEIKAADYPQIRSFTVPKKTSFAPCKDVEPGSWQVCTPETAGKFSAVAYFFARKLQETLKIPIGIIHTSWGGTNVETWTSREALLTHKDFEALNTPGPGSLAEIRRSKVQGILDKIRKFQQGDIEADDTSNWKNAEYDDHTWGRIRTPGFWESQGLPDLDGVVWYRKTVDLTAEQARKGILLQLAMIDDADETYVNGEKIGATSNYLAERKYRIPAGLLKEGHNTIAIRVTDTNAGGGIYGDADSLRLLVDGASAVPLAGEWRAKVDTAAILYGYDGPNSYPALLFNAMLAPLIPYGIRGAIWYQGESNGDRGYQYRSTFPLMIKDWRDRWKEGDFPFYFVQLSSFNAGNQNGLTGSLWAELREAQLKTLALPNTGMAVTIDIGNTHDVHPTNKQDVGLRLALNALHTTYGMDLVFTGPLYASREMRDSRIVLHFTGLGSGLQVKDKYGYLRGFQVAGADRQFKWAKAYVEGDKVIVYNEAVKDPVAVRYGWTDDAGEANLYNKEGLPASPFRTDDWPGLSVDTKYHIMK